MTLSVDDPHRTKQKLPISLFLTLSVSHVLKSFTTKSKPENNIFEIEKTFKQKEFKHSQIILISGLFLFIENNKK